MKSKMMIFCHHNGGSYRFFAFLLLLSLFLILISVSCVSGARHDRQKSTNMEAKVGSYAVFNCYIDFPYDFPIPYVVHWSKDDKKIFTWYEGEASANELYNGRLNIITNHEDYGKATANLTAIRESDQGWYHCQIVFPNRTPSIRNNGTWYYLTVQGGSLIKIPPVNQTIMEGQTAFFHCVMKYPNTSETSWYKDGVLLQDIPDLIHRSRLSPQGSLSIDPTMMSDYGEYECHVRSNDDEVQTAKAFLNIQYKAKVIYAPPEVYLPYGQPAVLDCHFRANPPLKNLRWEKDGLLFDSYNVPGVFYKMNGSLFFSKVDESHAGSYTCTPYNDLGTDGPSPVINVIVLRPPIFTITPKAIYIQKLGETTELPCQAIDRDGTNHPSIDWKRKDGSPLPEERATIKDGTLTITNLIETDRGMYECVATNEAATITAETELMIENLSPRPPYNLTANSSETTITIRWQPGYLRPNLEYTVWYRLTDAPEWRTMRIVQKNVMEATIQHLQPGREYEFMVLSQDKYGDGMFSKQFRFSTQPSSKVTADEDNVGVVESTRVEYTQHREPSSSSDNDIANNNNPSPSTGSLSAPWNLSAINNQQGWLLHWEHPQQGLDMLRLYTVRWWKEPEHHLVGTVETFDNFYQLRHLKEDSTFKVRVLAISADGDQVPSGELIIEVPSQRKMRALLIGSSIGVAFLLCALVAFLYVKRSCLLHLFTGDIGSAGKDVGINDGSIEDGCDSSEHTHDTEKINNT
ncbi:protein borderless [Lucilia sericata]|uniref:protein borderless n=1 Tax=Lucilia sericata TaxID=13632 RepID=UPI0018A7F18E|nr:protein borderless [Lucilia sericata]